MEISFGKGKTEHGPGVQIDLTGDEVAAAIYTYLNTHNVRITGPLTIRVNGGCVNLVVFTLIHQVQ
jgi:hypothetical protein